MSCIPMPPPAPLIVHNRRRARFGQVVVLLLLLSAAFAAHAAESAAAPGPGGDTPAAVSPEGIISAIRFTGNLVTREQILRQEMLVTEGDVADAARIERSRQAIMNLGLFTTVRAWLEPGPSGSVLNVLVKEKYYILPVPKLNRDEQNNISLGAELTIDNLAGLNQQLKLRYETDNAEGLSGGDVVTNTLSYTYPRIFGSLYLLHTELSEIRQPAEVPSATIPGTLDSLYAKESWSANLQLSRWLNPTRESRGWLAGGGLVWRHNSYDYVSGLPVSTFTEATAVGISVNAEYIDVNDYLYSRSGIDYGYQGEFGAPVLGSDTHYTRHEFYLRRYILLEGRPHENIDMQFRLDLSSGNIFPNDVWAYGLGGNKSLRGYPSSALQGNTFMLFNVQYLRPLFGYYPLRGVVFLDMGNTYPSNEQIRLTEIKWDVGVGLRLRLKSFVKIDLRLDVAYAPEIDATRVFLGTKEMF
jgi:outer membrane protein assembly factor BamA